jgi:hypothetical protein
MREKQEVILHNRQKEEYKVDNINGRIKKIKKARKRK